ncbi:MAG TPA: APC family permease [Bryobacteraceae bacterium]|nr:APC family permease [Bryobacteraceae bacterium]
MASAQSVRTHSAELRKELGLGDLVLTQIMYVVGTGWVGTAAKLGNQQIVFWLAAMALFYAPLAAAVIYLNRTLPLEGGLYQWAKLGFNDFAGFLVGWNLWLYVILIVATFGLGIAASLAYAIGHEALGSNKAFIVLVTCLLVAFLTLVTTLGLGVGKWFQSAGGLAQIIAFATLILVPFFGLRGEAARAFHPLAVATPAISLLSLNIFSKMAMGAFSGFEYVAILAGECKNPARNIGRSVLIASPLIALMFILGTSSVLAFVSPEQVDLVGPIPQVLTIALRPFRWAGWIAPAAILLLVGRQIGNCTLSVAGSTRLPMVAGWDHLLPEWFATLHPKYKTPVNSVLFVGALILVLGLLGITGVGQQEAFQILDNAAGVFYALAYLAMFALPMVGLRGLRKPPLWMRAAAASGFLVTLLYCVMSIFPIVQVTSRLSFAAKIGGVIAGANLFGASLYWLAKHKRAR